MADGRTVVLAVVLAGMERLLPPFLGIFD